MIRGGHMRASRTHAAGASSIARRAPRAGGRAAIARASLLEEVGARFGIGSEELRDERKEALLARIKTTNRGLGLSEEDAKEVDSLASALERINPTSSPLRSDNVNGKWKLVYTTSQVRASMRACVRALAIDSFHSLTHTRTHTVDPRRHAANFCEALR